MTHPVLIRAGLVLLAIQLSLPVAHAQLPWRWFGPKAADKGKTTLPDPRRTTEVNVEVAWLADPVTFPYYLEARAENSRLEVRGYVPSNAVREHALRIAQVYSALPVTDAMKEHPSLLVKPGKMSAQQLQSSVQSSLRVALPKQYQQLRVECGADGKVFVIGPVNSLEEKLAVSHSLRRLHGCTSVQNLTALPIEVVEAPREKLPTVKSSDKPLVAANPPETKPRSWLSWPFGKSGTTSVEPPLIEPRKTEPKSAVLASQKNPRLDGPILIPNVTEPKKDVDSANAPVVIAVELPAAPSQAPVLTVAELQKSIRTACPNILSAEVQFTSAKEARITLEIRNHADLAPAAEKVFALPELQNYRLDLQFKITAP